MRGGGLLDSLRRCLNGLAQGFPRVFFQACSCKERKLFNACCLNYSYEIRRNRKRGSSGNPSREARSFAMAWC